MILQTDLTSTELTRRVPCSRHEQYTGTSVVDSRSHSSRIPGPPDTRNLQKTRSTHRTLSRFCVVTRPSPRAGRILRNSATKLLFLVDEGKEAFPVRHTSEARASGGGALRATETPADHHVSPCQRIFPRYIAVSPLCPRVSNSVARSFRSPRNTTRESE